MTPLSSTMESRSWSSFSVSSLLFVVVVVVVVVVFWLFLALLRAVWSTFAEIHSTHPGVRIPYFTLPSLPVDFELSNHQRILFLAIVSVTRHLCFALVAALMQN